MTQSRVAWWLQWTPRVLGLLFAAFISLFALDAFGGDESFWRELLGFLIHLVPTYLVLAAVAVSWRRPIAGGVVWFALGLTYLGIAWGDFSWTVFALIAGPTWVIGGLHLAHGLVSRT